MNTTIYKDFFIIYIFFPLFLCGQILSRILAGEYSNIGISLGLKPAYKPAKPYATFNEVSIISADQSNFRSLFLDIGKCQFLFSCPGFAETI